MGSGGNVLEETNQHYSFPDVIYMRYRCEQCALAYIIQGIPPDPH
jgi:hypothetical protein